jgi:transposase
MMGRKALAGKLFYQVSLEELVSAGHLLRRVAEAVDFGVARRLTARFYSHTGQPSVDPVVLFKMALFGYLYGLPSERRLVEEIRLNLAYRWFIGYDLDEAIPDHSVLSKARRRFGPTIYEAFFTDLVRQCERAGLIRGDRLFLDSTLVAAHANLDRVGSRELIRQLSTVGEHVADLWDANPEAVSAAAVAPSAPASAPEPAGADDHPETSAAETVAEPADVSGERADLHLAGPDDTPNGALGLLNERPVSRTDPDATVVQRAKVPADLYHKVHVGVDGGAARIITAVEATTGIVGDELLLQRLVIDHEGNTHRRTLEVAADTKYGTIDNYQWLEQRDVRAAIPFNDGGSDHRLIPRSAFLYDAASDTYRCPIGTALRRQGRTTTTAAHPPIIYRPRPSDCADCPLKAKCCGTAKVRSVSRPEDGGLRDRTVAYLRTGPTRRLIRQRKAWVETVFGDGKERRGLRRARCRGLDAVRIQALLTATAQNIRKLALHRPAGPIPSPAHAPTASAHRPALHRRRSRHAPRPAARPTPRHPRSLFSVHRHSPICLRQQSLKSALGGLDKSQRWNRLTTTQML